MPSYKTILVAIKDLDARTMPAVRKAAQLAKAQGATLELFHALSDTILVDALEAKRISLKEFETERLAATMKRLETLARRIRKHDIEVTCAAEWDHPPAEAIVRRAMRIKADLIVAERHATRHVAGWMLAYTDWELLRNASCAVLLVKVPKPYHRPVILTAIDPFHTHEKPALLDAALLGASGTIAESLKGKLHIVHCVPPSTMVATGWASGPIVVDAGRGTKALTRARQALAAEVAKHPLPSHKLAILEGAAREAIPQAARRAKASLVVMGAVSRSGLKRLLIGNTAEAILDALNCDVLVIKPGRFQSKVARRSRGAQLMSLPNAMTG
ncbi:MAG: universal stress protein [Steroidobacteraceae bacterium]